MPLNRYIKRELIAFAWIMLPYIIILNLMMFGNCIFQSVAEFGRSFLYSGIYLVLAYFVFRSVAMFIRMRVPAGGDLFKRIGIMLPIFYVMNVLMLSGIFSFYEQMNLLTCTVKSDMLW